MIEPTAPVGAADRQRYIDQELWSTSETIPSLLVRNAQEFPDRVAVVDNSGTRVTYGELDALSSKFAAALAERGVNAGDVVGVQLPNRCENSIVTLGALRLGAVVNSLVPMYRERELEYAGNTSRTKVLVVPGTFRNIDHDALALQVAGTVPSLSVLVSLSESPPPGVDSLDSLLRRGETLPDYTKGRFADPELDPDAPAAVLFTSGTESVPKGAIHSHNTLLANDRGLAKVLGLTDGDGVFMASPLGHGTGFGFGLLLAPFLGGTLTLLDIWDPVRAAELIAAEGPVYTHASTPFAQDLLGVPDLGRYDFGSLRYFVSGGANIPSGFVQRMEDRLGCLLLRLFGQTEGFMTTINRPNDPLDLLDSRDGRAAPGVELYTCDESGAHNPPDVVGELLCRGPHRCLGFVDDPERTAATILPDGFMRTGDLCRIDAQGYMTVVGRKKEVINRGGYKFSPREIEDLLQLHSAVSRVAIVRMPDERLGERACAFVIPSVGHVPTLEEVVDYLKSQGVAPFKWPERLELVDQFPTTASGKVQKFLLEQELDESVRSNG